MNIYEINQKNRKEILLKNLKIMKKIKRCGNTRKLKNN